MTRLLAAVLFAVAVLAAASTAATLPQCEEDAVLIGTGDFDNGRWSAYMCGPAVDDFVPAGGPF